MTSHAQCLPLGLVTYIPEYGAMFRITSTLVTGEAEAVLIDAQLARTDARNLAGVIRNSGRELTTIYISHGDPDFYFGLHELRTAFPAARIVGTPQTVERIKRSHAEQLHLLAPRLGVEAPTEIIVPEVLDGDCFELEGRALRIVGLDGPNPDRTIVWIPSIQAVVGGIPLVVDQHVWMQDNFAKEEHDLWLAMLDRITDLHPQIVVPGHARPSMDENLPSSGTRGAFPALAGTSTELVQALRKRYPGLDAITALELKEKADKEQTWN